MHVGNPYGRIREEDSAVVTVVRRTLFSVDFDIDYARRLYTVPSHRARLVSPLCTVACTTVLFPFFSGVATLRIVTIRELLPTNLRQLVNNCLGIGDIVRHYSNLSTVIVIT